MGYIATELADYKVPRLITVRMSPRALARTKEVLSDKEKEMSCSLPMKALTLDAFMRTEVMSSWLETQGFDPSDRWGCWDKLEQLGHKGPPLMRARHEASVDSVGGTWCHSCWKDWWAINHLIQERGQSAYYVRSDLTQSGPPSFWIPQILPRILHPGILYLSWWSGQTIVQDNITHLPLIRDEGFFVAAWQSLKLLPWLGLFTLW